VDREGRIVFANRRVEAVFGWTPGEIVGQSVELLVPERHRPVHEGFRRGYVGAPVTRPMGTGLALRARRRDGSEFPVEISLSPLEEPDGPVIVAIVRDITDRVRIEEERARERADVDRLKDDLAHMIVHDLKNPVNGIAMTVQAMLRRGGELSERHRANLAVIDRTCRDTLRLTHNLLEIAKIEAGKMPIECEPVDLATTVREVVDEYGPLAEEAGKRLIVALDAATPRAVADPALLRRVVVNLVVNAIRHSGARQVQVDVLATPGTSEVVLRVMDDGCGIPPEDREIIFDKFRATRRRSAASADTGLGLPFCKLAIERMGGQIALVELAQAPTVFAITLPRAG
jgi:protein-histidine pros-kinase